MRREKSMMKKVLAFVIALLLIFTGTWVDNAIADEQLDKSSNILGSSGSYLGDSGNIPLGISAPMLTYAMGDVGVSLSSESAVYNAYSNVDTGAVPPQMNAALSVSIEKDNLTNVSIVLDTGILDGYLGAGNPYFVYNKHSEFGADSIFSGVVNNLDGTFTIKVKDNQPINSTESMTLLFDLDPAYDGNVSPGAKMTSMVADAFVDGNNVGKSANSLEIKANTNTKTYDSSENKRIDITPFVPSTTESDGNFLIFNGQVVSFRSRSNNYNYHQHKLDLTYKNAHRYYLPVGTKIELGGGYYIVQKGVGDNGVEVADGEVSGVPAGKYFVFEFIWPKSPGSVMNDWAHYPNRKTMGYAQHDLSFSFPDMETGKLIPMYNVLEYKLISDTQPTIVPGLWTYRVDNGTRWLYRFVGTNSTGGAAFATTGLSSGDVSNIPINTGYDYAHSGTSGNYGNVPITNLKVRLFQKNAGLTGPKVNFHNVFINFARDSTKTPWAKINVYAEVTNALTGAVRPTDTVRVESISTTLLRQFVAVPDFEVLTNLGDNEFVSSIYAIPMGADGTTAGTLPVGTAFSFQFAFKAWNDRKWPDGSRVEDYTTLYADWEVSYDDAAGVPIGTPKLASNFSASAGLRYFVKGPLPVVQGAPISSNQSSVEPSSIVTYRLTGYNQYNIGAQTTWDEPVIIVGMPAGVHFGSKVGITAKDKNGNVMHVISVQTLKEEGTRSYYKLTFPIGTKIERTDTALAFTIDFDVKVPMGIPAGQYILDLVLTSNPANNFYMGNIAHQNNTLPAGQTKADYGLGAGDNYTYSVYPGYQQVPFTVLSKSKSNASSRIQSDKMGDTWTSARVAPADFGDNVKMQLIVNNNGNNAMSNIKLYDIIPYNGYKTTEGYESSGSVGFTGISNLPAGAEVYYYHGAGDPPKLNTILGITVPSADWNTTAAGAKAFLVDFKNNAISGGATLDVTMNFKVPTTTVQQTVYNQFSFSYTTTEGNAFAVGVSQGFSTHYYNVSYSEAAADVGKVFGIPEVQSGGFDAAVAVDVILSTVKPTKEFYNFSHWKNLNTDGNGASTYTGGETVVFKVSPPAIKEFKDLKLEAVFTPDPAYAITVNYKPGTGATGTIVPASVTAHAGDIISAPDISGLKIPGKKPSGKFLTTSGGVFDFAVPLGGSPTAFDLTVEWIRDDSANFALSFDITGGDAASKPLDMNAILGIPVGTLPGGDDGTGAGAPTKLGHNFKGWTKTNGSSVADFFSTDTITAPTTVYAVWELKTYTVTLNGNSATTPGTTSLAIKHGNPAGTDFKLLPTEGSGAPERTSHKFLGWASTNNALDADFTQGMLAGLTGSQTLYAVWVKNEHIITLNGNNATNEGAVKTLTVKEGGSGYSLPNTSPNAPKKYGYTLQGWSKDKTLPNINNDDPAVVTFFKDADLPLVTGPITIYAVWKPNTYTLTFNQDGGTAGSVTSKPIIFGEKVGVLPTETTGAPTRAGYVFKGWSAASGTEVSDFTENYIHTEESGKTIYAAWERKAIEVKLNPNGGTVGSIATLNVKFGNQALEKLPVALEAKAPTKAGHNLVGWAKTSTMTPAFTNAELATITADTEIFAVWELKTYKVNLNGNGATTIGTTEISIKHGNLAGPNYKELPAIGTGAPEKIGYDFKGWSLTSGTNQVEYTNAELAAITEDITELYAIWKLKEYKVTLDGNNDTGTGYPKIITIKHGNPTGPDYKTMPRKGDNDIPTRTGYTFEGWSTRRNDTVDFTDDKLTSVTGDTTVFAVWKRIVYQLTLDGNKATTTGTVSLLSVEEGNNGPAVAAVLPTIPPTAPARTGYTFGGWSTSDTGTIADFDAASLVALRQSKTVYAVWAPLTYTLTFDPNHSDLAGATDPSPTSKPVTFDMAIGAIPLGDDAPTRTGYKFQGWADTKTSGSPNITASKLYETAGNSSAYAVWDINKYTVNFDADGGGSKEGFPLTRQVKYNFTLGADMPTVQPTKVGYDFQGWATTRGAVTADFNSGIQITDSISVYAVWKVQTYVVTFDSGDALTPAAPASINADYNTTLVGKMPSEPAKTGHIFNGWSAEKQSDTVNFDENTLILAPITVYPVWETIKYEITVEQWFYAYNQTSGQAVQGSKVTTERVAYGSKYTSAPEEIEGYNFMPSISKTEIAMITGSDTIKQYYQSITYTVSAKAEVELSVNDRYPAKNNAISLKEFISLAEISYTSNSTKGNTRSTGKPLPPTVDIVSPDFAKIDYTAITLNHGQSVELDITWPDGQAQTLTVMVQIVDRVAPRIQIVEDQRFNIKDRVPSSEAELISMLTKRGMTVADNYDEDKDVDVKITYLDGSFSKMPWNKPDQGSIIFLTAVDKSGNVSEQRRAVILTWRPTGEGGTDVPDGDNHGTGGKGSGGSTDKDGNGEDLNAVKGIEYDKETSTITLNGKPTLKLPKTGGGKAALALGVLGIPASLFLLFLLAGKGKKEEEETDRTE